MVIPKASILSFLCMLVEMDYFIFAKNNGLLILSAVLGIVMGATALLYQFTLKKFVAISGVPHISLVLLLIFSKAYTSYIFYIIVYSLTIIGIFYGCIALNGYKSKLDVDLIAELKGGFNNNRVLSLMISLILFSLAGCPPTLGFAAKFWVLWEILNGD